MMSKGREQIIKISKSPVNVWSVWAHLLGFSSSEPGSGYQIPRLHLYFHLRWRPQKWLSRLLELLHQARWETGGVNEHRGHLQTICVLTAPPFTLCLCLCLCACLLQYVFFTHTFTVFKEQLLSQLKPGEIDFFKGNTNRQINQLIFPPWNLLKCIDETHSVKKNITVS